VSNGDTKVDVISEGAKHLDLAIRIAMEYHVTSDRSKEPTVSHWMEEDGRLIFLWSGTDGGNAFVVPHTREMLVPLILSWLTKQDYGEEPDMDGSVSKGWRLKAAPFLLPSHKARFYMQFMVTPEWMEYHK
jgi:hypothetical protein